MKQGYRKLFFLICFCISSGVAFAVGHTVTITNSTDALCFGSCTGSATTSVSGGTGPFSYSWSPSAQTTPNASGLCAGTYTVTVTDQSDGSTATATVNIAQPPNLNITFSNVNNATCNQANGSVCGIVSGGIAPYTYMWSPPGAISACINNLPSGAYFLTVTDMNGCTNSASVVITNAPGSNISSITASPATICAGQSSVLNPTISGGTPPFTYSWTNPGNSLSSTTTSNPVASPIVTTTYTLTVTDANACVSNNVATVFVNQAVVATVSENDPTCNQANGSMTVNVTQAASPFNILWSNSATTSTISNLTAGVYSVTVTDANGCSASFTSGLSNIGGPSVTTSTTDASCTNSNNGTATANVTGIAPFTYQWNSVPAQTSQTASGLDAGNYLVSVTDSAGCVSVIPAQVNALAGNLYMYVYSIIPSNCNMPTGVATVNVSGGTQPYTYSWSNGNTTQSAWGVMGGTYSVTVNDANGCGVTAQVNVPSICANVVLGRAYYDSNQNNIYDSVDFPLGSLLVGITPANYYSNTNANGQYNCYIWSAGTFTVSYNSTYLYYTCGTPSQQVTFPGFGDTAIVDFAFTSTTQFQDLYLNLASGPARPGFSQYYHIHCENRGVTVSSDTIWFRHDSILSLLNVYPPFDGYSFPDGYWLYSNFLPGQQINKTVWVQVPTIPNGGYIGRQLIANARIEPMSSDTTSPDNGDDEVDIITASYDPNLKECWSPTMNPSGDIWPSDVTLDYTIHFQNSGTDTAFTVVVVDTLPVELDITTFRIGASSHPCTYSISGYNDTNVVTFTFMNILLPDSNINEPASHGYVQFTIDRDPNLPIGTQIRNEANNYFDFNPAVVTNMNVVTISNPLAVTEPEANDVKLYPNPAQNNVNVMLGDEYAGKNAIIVLRDVTGREIARVNSNGSTLVNFDLDKCSAGVYFITAECSGEKTVTKKLVISEK